MRQPSNASPLFQHHCSGDRENTLAREDCVKLTNVLCDVGRAVGHLLVGLEESGDSSKSTTKQQCSTTCDSNIVSAF